MTGTVLVTGAAGFIGSALVRELSIRNWKIVAVDGLLGGLYGSSEKEERFKKIAELPGVETLKLDLRVDDLSVLPSSITHVVNEAAMPGLELSWRDFDLYASCNINALSRLIEISRNWSIERFIQVSTSSVYGAHATGDENQELAPVSPYGATKLAAENLALAHWRDSGFPATILRYFSVYGPGQRPDMAYRKFIEQALKEETITIYGTGEQSRSNTFISDAVSGTIGALENAESGDIFNISGNEERTLNEALAIIEKEVGATISVRKVERARGDQQRTSGDSSRAHAKLGFTQTVNLEEGLKRQVDWQRSRL